MHVPGHTPADMAYVIGERCSPATRCSCRITAPRAPISPAATQRQLYRSIRRLLSLPDETRLFLCHDYKAPGRDSYVWETTVGAERAGNVHARDGVSEAEFVAMRTARDATLACRSSSCRRCRSTCAPAICRRRRERHQLPQAAVERSLSALPRIMT